MTSVTIHVAKTTLSKLIALATAGEDVVISRGATPVVRLVPVNHRKPKRAFGALKGAVAVTDAFFEPLTKRELEGWE